MNEYNLNKGIYIMMIFLCFKFTGQAQQSHHFCGTSFESQYVAKEKLLKHRQHKNQLLQGLETAQLFKSNIDSIFYVPVFVHITGNADGTGYIEIERVLQSICKLNQDYQDQNIQFYLSGHQYLDNSVIYNHGASSGDPTATYVMSLYKVPHVLNIFIGRNVEPRDEFLAYYTSFLDIVYTFKSGVGANDPTLTHELGHFFTLPHTFFGWEGTHFSNEVINGKAPNLVGGVEVEKVARQQTGENCQLAADGFCDTPPDYSSSRTSCPYNDLWRDPDSVLLNPDETNFMSYYADACMSRFTDEQKEAILLDVVSRGYHDLAKPSPLLVEGMPSLIWPIDGALAGSPNAVELRWNAADSSDLYLVHLKKIFNGVELSSQSILSSETSLWVTLEPNATYRWSVKALTRYDLCANARTATATFNTADWATGVEQVSLPINYSKIYPNPVSAGNKLVIELETLVVMEASITIYNSFGQQIMPIQRIQLQRGRNQTPLQLENLAQGVYMIDIQTGQERIVHKLVVQE